MMWFLHIAQLSTTISHDQRATADHFLTSNRFGLPEPAAEVDEDGNSGLSDFGSTSIPSSSMSAILEGCCDGRSGGEVTGSRWDNGLDFG